MTNIIHRLSRMCLFVRMSMKRRPLLIANQIVPPILVQLFQLRQIDYSTPRPIIHHRPIYAFMVVVRPRRRQPVPPEHCRQRRVAAAHCGLAPVLQTVLDVELLAQALRLGQIRVVMIEVQVVAHTLLRRASERERARRGAYELQTSREKWRRDGMG